jgi:hypothetical protein
MSHTNPLRAGEKALLTQSVPEDEYDDDAERGVSIEMSRLAGGNSDGSDGTCAEQMEQGNAASPGSSGSHGPSSGGAVFQNRGVVQDRTGGIDDDDDFEAAACMPGTSRIPLVLCCWCVCINLGAHRVGHTFHFFGGRIQFGPHYPLILVLEAMVIGIPYNIINNSMLHPVYGSPVPFGYTFVAIAGAALGSFLHLRCALSDPGISMAGQRTAADGKWCSVCNCYVDRSAHHCSECGVCIAKLHHHCVWMGKCVGGSKEAGLPGNIDAFWNFNCCWVVWLIYAFAVILTVP